MGDELRKTQKEIIVGTILGDGYLGSRGKTYYRLYIGAEGRDRLLKIVKPYVLPCFSYKLSHSN